MAVDGIDLANDGSIPFRKGERVELHYYFSQLFKGDRVQLRILRDGVTTEVSVPVYIHQFAVRPHLNNAMPSYFMVRAWMGWAARGGDNRVWPRLTATATTTFINHPLI